MNLTFLYGLIMIFPFAFATFYSKEDKICDPSGTGLITYTGFRVHREYIVKGLGNAVIHFNSFSHCEKGVVDYERVISVDRNVDIEFNKPFCLLKPESAKKKKNKRDSKMQNISTVLDGLAKGSLKIDKGRNVNSHHRREEEPEQLKFSDYSDIKDIYSDFQDSLETADHNLDMGASNSSTDAILQKSVRTSSLMGHLMDFAQGVLSTFMGSTQSIEYIGRKTSNKKKPFQLLTPKEFTSSSFTGNDLTCYNMVKRKKYVKREMSIFAPHRFIGGIFECALSNEDKEVILTQYKSNLTTPHVHCDPESSRAIAPLISDNISKQWFQMSSSGTMMQRIPYLYTPTALDVRFNDNSALFKDDWADELHVNQDYEFDSTETGILTKTITETSNLICQMLIAMETKLNENSSTDDEDKHRVSELLKNLEVRFLSHLGLASQDDAIETMEIIEKSWDELDIA